MHTLLYSTHVSEQYRFAMYCMSVLVNCTSLEMMEKSLRAMKFLFNSPFWSKDVQEAVRTINEMLKSIECHEERDESVSDEEDDLDALERDNEDTLMDEEDQVNKDIQKPFGAYFEQRLRKGKTHESVGEVPNKFFKPGLFPMLQRKWLPTIPIWSCLMRGSV